MDTTLIILIAIALVMLAIGGLFAAAESALAVRSRSELYRLAEGSGRVDRAIRAIADDEGTHANALAFARVITESLFAAIITVVLASVFEENVWLTLLVATLVLIGSTFVLVGTSPRNVGMTHPSKILRLVAPIIRLVRIILGPIATGLIRVSTRVSERTSDSEFDTEERHLISMVDRAAERNLLAEEDRAYIQSFLQFGDTLAREVMVPRTDMITVSAESTVLEAFEQLLASRHTRLPVVEAGADDIHGIVTLRDLAGFVHRKPQEAATSPVTRMMRETLFVPDVVKASDLMQLMQQKAHHLALTVDEYGGISGLVTLEDLIEELIGEIYDEHDRERPEVEPQSDGSFVLNPRLSLSELGQLFDIEIEDDDVDTVAGLLVKELGRLAVTDDAVTVAGIELTALQTDRRHIIHSIRATWVGGNGEETE